MLNMTSMVNTYWKEFLTIHKHSSIGGQLKSDADRFINSRLNLELYDMIQDYHNKSHFKFFGIAQGLKARHSKAPGGA